MTILVSRASVSACIMAVALSVLPLSGASTPEARLRTEHQRVLDDLNVKDSNGKPIELGDPRISPLLQRGWGLAGDWAAAWLEKHRTPSPHDLERIFDGFTPAPKGTKSPYGNFLEYIDYSLRGNAVQIAPGVYVVQATYGVEFVTGTFIVVARNREGHFQALWNIKDLAAKHYPQGDEIGRWMYLVRRAYYNGPLAAGKILPLPSSRNGHARFLVVAFQSADGGTHGAQLSIWDWDGAAAKPLLVEPYDYVAEDFGAFRFDGTTVRITTKENIGALWSCGMCDEPQGIWRVRITPNGVANLGHQFVKPELQWADELLSKIDSGEDTSKLADGKVLANLQAWIRDAQAEARNPANPAEPIPFSWGMLDSCKVLLRGQRGAFVIQTDDANLSIRYVLKAGKPYFTSVDVK